MTVTVNVQDVDDNDPVFYKLVSVEVFVLCKFFYYTVCFNISDILIKRKVCANIKMVTF